MAPADTDLLEPHDTRRPGCNLFLIALTLLLIGALAYWGYEASDSGAPTPSSTGVPPTAPPAAGR